MIEIKKGIKLEMEISGLNGQYFSHNGTKKLKICINNVTELDSEKLMQLPQIYGVEAKDIVIEISKSSISMYDKSTYVFHIYKAILKKLQELTSGVDTNLPEKQRFKIIYERVCKALTYDYPAAYPKTEAERAYSNQVRETCRNLKNGLLEGKCVCAGYADILRNALLMVGIEAEYISGEIVEKRERLDFSSGRYKKFPIGNRVLETATRTVWIPEQGEEGIYYSVEEGHAWNKVKLDGIWYNVDPTWDSPKIRNGQLPANCLKTDEQIMKEDKKMNFKGPECTHDGTEEMKKLFYPKYIKEFIKIINKINLTTSQMNEMLSIILKDKAKKLSIDTEDQNKSLNRLKGLIRFQNKKRDIKQIEIN